MIRAVMAESMVREYSASIWSIPSTRLRTRTPCSMGSTCISDAPSRIACCIMLRTILTMGASPIASSSSLSSSSPYSAACWVSKSSTASIVDALPYILSRMMEIFFWAVKYGSTSIPDAISTSSIMRRLSGSDIATLMMLILSSSNPKGRT